MILLHCVLLFSVINVSCQELPTPNTPDIQTQQPCSRAVTLDEISDLRVQIAEQNTRIAQLNTIIANQNTKIAVQNVKISDHNVKLAKQDIKILDQNTKIKDLEMKIEELEKDSDRVEQPSAKNDSTLKETGSIFTRWGRRDCPGNVSQLVYSGIIGGSHYTHTGAAAEYVCLPPDPMWNVNKHYNAPYWGYMYGSEYGIMPQSVHNYKVPCAVCRTSQFSTVLMIPARTECYQGWKKAYNGELVSGNHEHAAASQYVCLDDNPQTTGTNTDVNGKLMNPVRAKCGALPCPPYEDNTLLTCVVCLK